MMFEGGESGGMNGVSVMRTSGGVHSADLLCPVVVVAVVMVAIGIFKHDHQGIGYVELPKVTARGGSVTDVRRTGSSHTTTSSTTTPPPSPHPPHPPPYVSL